MVQLTTTRFKAHTSNNEEEAINARMKSKRPEARLGVPPAPFAGAHRRVEGARRLEDAGRRAAEQEQEPEKEPALLPAFSPLDRQVPSLWEKIVFPVPTYWQASAPEKGISRTSTCAGGAK